VALIGFPGGDPRQNGTIIKLVTKKRIDAGHLQSDRSLSP
jgi:hypothetical protein